MKVKLTWYVVNQNDFSKLKKLDYGNTLAGVLGSSPKLAGMVIEGMVVPEGEVWLFNKGGNVELFDLLAKEGIKARYREVQVRC